MNYSKFVELRRERIEQQMRAYRNQQKQIADTRSSLSASATKPPKPYRCQSRMKQLAKIERIEVDEVDNSHLSLRFPPAPRSVRFSRHSEEVAKHTANIRYSTMQHSPYVAVKKWLS